MVLWWALFLTCWYSLKQASTHNPSAHILVGLSFYARVHNAKQLSQAHYLPLGYLLVFLFTSLQHLHHRRMDKKKQVKGPSAWVKLSP